MLVVLAAAALSASCRTGDLALEPPEQDASAQPDRLLELVRFGNRIRETEARELAETYRSLAFGDAFWSNDAAIRLSLLLSTPDTPYHDVDQAARLLRDVLEREPARSTEHKDLAQLLLHLLSERVYAASEDENLAGLLSEARDRNERLNGELEAVRAELRAERERRRTLEQQLDALRRLEEQLSLDSIGRP